MWPCWGCVIQVSLTLATPCIAQTLVRSWDMIMLGSGEFLQFMCIAAANASVCVSQKYYHIYNQIYIYIYTYICIYMLTPPETYRFDIFCVLQWILVFAFKSSHHFFIHLKTLDAWSSWVMMLHLQIQWHTVFWWYLQRCRLPCCVPNKFNSNIDRMRTELWPNVNFKLYIYILYMFFYRVFILDTFRSCRSFLGRAS